MCDRVLLRALAGAQEQILGTRHRQCIYIAGSLSHSCYPKQQRFVAITFAEICLQVLLFLCVLHCNLYYKLSIAFFACLYR